MIRLIGGLLLVLGLGAAAELVWAEDELPGTEQTSEGAAAAAEEAEAQAAFEEAAAVAEEAGAQAAEQAAGEASSAAAAVAAEPKFSLIEGSRVSIEKKCPEKRFVGTPVKFQLVVANDSNSTARDVVVFDQICDPAKFIKASEGGTLKDGQVIWELGDLAAGESRTLTTTVEATEIGAELDCLARAEWRAMAAVEDKCKTIIVGIPAILLEVIDLEDPVEVGDVVTYEIAVTNQGSLEGRNIVLKATLPNQLEYISASGPTEPSAEGQIVTFGALPTLPAKEKAPANRAVWTMKAKAVGVGDIRFRLDLTSEQSPEPIFETESTNLYD